MAKWREHMTMTRRERVGTLVLLALMALLLLLQWLCRLIP